ncbi:MAG: PQQ-dependent sugar dehydrogenase [Anaerolineales bacterium]|nr:PQQ-dependent sugar dehydrogenase [Anaerolineales bacterium]
MILILGLLLSGCNPFASPEPEVVGQPPTSQPVEATSTPLAEPGHPETVTPESLATPEVIPTQIPVENAAVFPDTSGFSGEVIASGLQQPVYLTYAGDGSGRLFIVEKPGTILIIQNGELLPAPFLNISNLVNSRDFERGLLGLAFHPDYTQNGRFYVNYTNLNGDTVVSSFQVSENANIANPDSQQILMTISQPYANHNGGMIAFGPDGYLYIGMGDGGSGGDPQGNAQNPDTLLGKILRIDVDSGTPYAIPEGNSPIGRPEIWALGLRNPWRFSFDQATGDLLIGDVGQNQWEEIHILPVGILGGINLGWDYYEGTHPFEGSPPEGAGFISPVIEYKHSGGNCSVTGGYVYRGSLPEWQGIYLYGDYCSGVIWGALASSDGSWQTKQLFSTESELTSFGQDQDGALYALYRGGKVIKLVAGMP